jgi:NDP-sugar pyrophosphorylase family protein
MKGMILAAGFGTRFRPVTYTTPKPMVPVCNRPLIAYAAEALLAAGVTDLIVNLYHLPDPIERYLRSTFGSRTKLFFSREAEILGTGGGVRKVRSFLESEDDFLLVNGDTIQRPPFEELLRNRRESDHLAALTLRHPPKGDRFTRVYFDRGVITGIGSGTGEPLMFSGSHAISRRIFDRLPNRDFSGIAEDVYGPALKEGSETIGGVIHDGLWFDIGTPLRYLQASAAITQLMVDGGLDVPNGSRVDKSKRSIAAADARIEGEAEDSVIGNASSVERETRIRNSSLWDSCRIGRGCSIESSVIDHGVVVPAGMAIANALVSRVTHALPPDHGFRVTGELVVAPIDPARPLIVE